MKAPGRLESPVIDLDGQQILRGNGGGLLIRDMQLHDVPEVESDAAVLRSRTGDHGQRFLQSVNHGERHELEDDSRSVVCGVRAEGSEGLNQAGHRSLLAEKIADLYVPRSESFGGGQQHFFTDIGLFFLLAVQKPVGEKFEFDMPYAAVLEDLFHFLETSALEGMCEVGMPDSHSFETGFRRGLHTIFEVKRAVLAVGMGQGSARNGPVGSEQLNMVDVFSFSVRLAALG